MSSNNRSRRRWSGKKNPGRGNRNKNKAGGNKQGGNKPARQPRPGIDLDPLVKETADCPICGELIKDITSALSIKGEGGPAHFDCVLNQIKEQETTNPGETIIYLGKGDFGVVNEEEYQKGKLQILRKIGYEQLDNREDWRMNMRQDVNFRKKS